MAKTKTKLDTAFQAVLVLLIGAVFLIVPKLGQATNYRTPEVYTRSTETKQNSLFNIPFHQDFKGGADIAIGDLGGDGVNEIIVAPGPGAAPEIKIYRSDKTLVNSFYAYDQNFNKGVVVDVGDVNGDGADEIICGTRYGGAPQVRVFNGSGQVYSSFFAFREDLRSGVNVAAADTNSNGVAEILAAAGTGVGPHVRGYSGQGDYIGFDIFPFSLDFKGGISIAAGNVDGGADEEIVIGVQRYSSARIKVYKTDINKTIVGNFLAFPDSYSGGVNLGVSDLDGDGLDEVVVAANTGGGPQVRSFEAYGENLGQDFFAYEEEFKGGVRVAGGDTDNNGTDEIIFAPNFPPVEGRMDLVKYIEVNLTEQKLYAYEYGTLSNSFLVSTGLYRFPTPPGNFSVLSKTPVKRYQWSYGPGHPDNYNLPNVKWNLNFYNSFYLHGAYWHNNFGHRMSHGCVNIHNSNAEWLYNWADVGIPVIVHN